MKICLTSTTNNPQGQLDPHFGRCPHLLIINTETLQYEAIPNRAAAAGIEIYNEATGSIEEVLVKLKAGQLKKANSATVGEQFAGIRREA